MKEHKLKIKKEYLNNIVLKKKTAEVRHNDRDFQVGDTIYLYDYDKIGVGGNILSCDRWSAFYKISHIHSGFGMADNYVILSFKKVEVRREEKGGG